MIERLKRSIPATVYLIFIFFAVIFTGFITPDGIGKGESVYLLIVTLESMAFLLPSIIYCHTKGFDYTKGLEIKIPELSKLPVVFSGLFAMISLNVLLSLVFMNPEKQQETGQIVGGEVQLENVNVIGVIIALAVIPAICEEFVFRAVLMRDYNKYGAMFSIICTSLMFAMIHYDISGFPIYFTSGIFLAMTVYITRSIVCSILVHAMYNIYSLFFEGWFWSSVTQNVNLVMIIFIAVAVLLLSLLFFFSAAEKIFVDYADVGIKAPEGYKKEKKDFEKADNEDGGEKRAVVAEVLPQIGICFLIFIVYIIVKG